RGAVAHGRARSRQRAGRVMPMAWYFDDGTEARYLPVRERRANALLEARRLQREGRALDPVRVEGRKIVGSFWGKAWCDNLEQYSDFANRLPRGRSYLRNGSVIDLRIAAGRVDALVCGTEVYEVALAIGELSRSRWRTMVQE